MLLGKKWGITDDYIVMGISCASMYFTGLEGLYAAYDAVDEILQGWDPEAAVIR